MGQIPVRFAASPQSPELGIPSGAPQGVEGVRSIRYLGITTSHGRRHSDFADVMQAEPLDFVQLTYNILDREVEDRLLPLAADRGQAVIVNRPFQRGGLFQSFGHHPLPEWAREFGASNWAQFFLKFVLSHPAVTCAIPATSQVGHMEGNMAAARGPCPTPLCDGA